jgi:hypothetical protein
VGFTAKWALIPKLRPFKANKYLNPVSTISTSEVLVDRPERAVTPLKINTVFLNSENGPWGFAGTKMVLHCFLFLMCDGGDCNFMA